MPLPPRTTERLVVSVATLVVVVGLVGSLWTAGFVGSADRPRIAADAGDRYESIDGLSGTRTTTIERNGTVRSERTYAVELRPGTGEYRRSLVDGTETRYDVHVSNGTVLWSYDRSENVVTRIPLTGVTRESGRADRLRRLFARLEATETTGDAPDGPPTVEPLPVVPVSSGGGAAAAGDADGATLGVDYVGTATVADRDVHVLRIAPSNDAADAAYEQTLWVDAERFFPLKQRTAWTDDGQRTVLTTTYEDVQFDPGLGDGAFEPEFPANATVRTPETPETDVYRQVADLRSATDLTVPTPDVPPTFELAYATRTTGRVQGVGLRYVNGTAWVTVAKYDFTHPADEGEERVTVDGRRGSLSRGTRVTLSWNCDDYRYTVRGRGVPSDLVVDVARSTGCPDAGNARDVDAVRAAVSLRRTIDRRGDLLDRGSVIPIDRRPSARLSWNL